MTTLETLETVRNELVEICACYPRDYIEATVDRLERRPPYSKHPTALERAIALLVLQDGYNVKTAAKVLNRTASRGHQLLRKFCRWANPRCYRAGEYGITNGHIDYTAEGRYYGPELSYLRKHATEFLRAL